MPTARVKFEHIFADLAGIPADRLTDLQGLSGLLLSAANAAGLSPAAPPLVKSGPRGVAAVLLCHGGHVALHALPDEGVCFADVAGGGGRGAHPPRAVDILVKRLGARDIRLEQRRRGAVPQPSDPELP